MYTSLLWRTLGNDCRFLKEKMISNPCQNQGYVLDGYPTTTENARALFQAEDDEEEQTAEEEEEEGGEGSFNKKIMPEYVISLDATDDVLYSHVMDLPADEFKNNIYSEENIISRIAEFRKINTNEDTVLNYFDELEVHPFLLDVTNDTSLYMEKTFKIIIDKIGKPRNYGSISGEDDEFTKQEKLIEEKELLKQARKEELIRRAIEEQQAKMEEWANLLDALKEEEEQLLAIQGMPARHYLMRYIFPTLTRGLLEVAHVRPEDPVDYLAEYLFRENPEGKMFQPDYVEAAEDLMNAVQLFKDSLIKADVLDTTDSTTTFRSYHRFQQYKHNERSFHSQLSPIGSKEEPGYEPRNEFIRNDTTEEPLFESVNELLKQKPELQLTQSTIQSDNSEKELEKAIRLEKS